MSSELDGRAKLPNEIHSPSSPTSLQRSKDASDSNNPTPTRPSPSLNTSQSSTPSSMTPSNSIPSGLKVNQQGTVDLSQSETSLPSHTGPIHSTSPIARRVSVSEASTNPVHRVPKPRSNSALQSSRPAPPSPASSRPASGIFSLDGKSSPVPSSPGLDTVHPPRDRSSSTSSSRASAAAAAVMGAVGRRSSLGTGRVSSKSRPKSALGASFIAQADAPYLPESGASTVFSTSHSAPSAAISGLPSTTPSTNLPDSSLTTTAIPEYPSPRSSTTQAPPQGSIIALGSPDPTSPGSTANPTPTPTSPTTAVGSTPTTPPLPAVIIRDYAFPPTDPRFQGPGLPLSGPGGSSARRSSSRWFGLGSDDNSHGNGGSGPSKKSWGGFGFMSFRNLIRRKDSSDSNASGLSGMGTTEGDEEYRLPVPEPDHDEDDYAFSSDSGLEEDEPWGLYRAVYPFEAVGEHEIGMEEGDLVDVRGRGGGEGWVVGVRKILSSDGRVVSPLGRGEEEKEGLVPESYLEKVDLKALEGKREKIRRSGEKDIANPSSSTSGSTDDFGRARQAEDTIMEEGEEASIPTGTTTFSKLQAGGATTQG
ncbi:hypothetical protein BD324DRAFT_683357 [Kockovaella imperatae]|uniref:SH3 domain-containing protein n=1 Tax=Kockovaella imperatae TaxID=4999 RepID=A0A1Y1UA29_9TREE|nr:hypothetical protein BD324DRAFT_683357 [Kockovaella imperatae]ORX34404.1 hypothetical protein BD324DRAFT_683357 [Kockovaella imperatae]